MVEDKWLLLAAAPAAVFLGLSIRRRIRDLDARIAQLKREDAAGPINPYLAMFEMTSAAVWKPGSRSAMGKSSGDMDKDDLS